jgi:hypothetical protein
MRWKSSKSPVSNDVRNAFSVLAGQGRDTLRMMLQLSLVSRRDPLTVVPSMRACNSDVRMSLLCGSSPEK